MTRNPLDTLLSSINHLHNVVDIGRITLATAQSFLDDLLLGFTFRDGEDFMSRIHLDSLCKYGYLDQALERFGYMGLNISMYYGMSDISTSFPLSYHRPGIRCMSIKYEHIATDRYNSNKYLSGSQAAFLDYNASLLAKGFELRNANAQPCKNAGVGFYKNISHNY